ncbi:MAG: DUF5906 domain-containing protein [Pseudolabrys sp.]|nr:DUF5906 domain-containing protein [Pseudolabrys sp.]
MTTKPLKFPPRRAFKLSVKRTPLFGWDAPADLQAAKDYLRKAKSEFDIGGFHVEQHIEELRQLGIHPAVCVAYIAGAYPVAWKESQDTVRELSGRVAATYADAATDPGEKATGNQIGEENSDGGWDFPRWKGTKFARLAVWQWITASMQFIHDDGVQMLNDKQFERQFGGVTDKRLMASIDRRVVPLKRFARQVYIPKASPVTKHDGQTVFNLWRPSAIEPDFGDHQWFLDHVAMLFPNDTTSRDLLLDYMAQLVQHPEVKIHFALLLQSIEGVGKGALGRVLRRLVGERNSVEPTSDEFTSVYTTWQEGKQLAIVNELMVDGKRDVLDRLKAPITEDTLRIHKKYGNPFTIPNHLNFFCMTNHKDALPITTHDRRWLILFSPAAKQSKEYYGGLFANINDTDKIAAVMGYLLAREIAFDPKGPAPTTEAKRDMQERARSDIRMDLQSLYDGGLEPFVHPLVRAEDILDHLRTDRRTSTRPGLHSEVYGFLDHVHALKLPRYKSRLSKLPPYQLYAIRDHETWANAAPLDTARAYAASRVPEDDLDFG